jgi:hypothetical protein
VSFTQLDLLGFCRVMSVLFGGKSYSSLEPSLSVMALLVDTFLVRVLPC